MKPKTPIYMDHAAATPLDERVRKEMLPYLDRQYFNPSSIYRAAKQTRQAIEQARAAVADQLGAKKTEIIFTAGGTESCNLAILGVARQFPGSRIVVTAIEHPAVLNAAKAAAAEGSELEVVPVKPNGIVDINVLLSKINDKTVMVSVMYANNEIGTIQPVARLAKTLTDIRSDRRKRGVSLPLYLHTDACQGGGALDLHVSRLGVDLLTLNGSKIYGPKQSGCLYVRTGTQLKPLVYGGGQERGLRSGTESPAGIVGFARALELAQTGRQGESKHLSQLRDYCWREIHKEIPDVMLNGDPANRLANNLNLTIKGIDGENLVLYLDKEGILASTGSACSSVDQDPSHVLLAIGLTRDQANSSLRLTFGKATDRKQIDYLLEVLPTIVNRLRNQ